MTDAAAAASQPEKRKRGTQKKSAPQPTGDYTSIRVPLPPASAFNKNRPPGCLLQAQLRHIHHAESARLPKEKRDGRRPEDIRTEAEAAAYIESVTRLLHPQGRKKSRARATR